MPERDVDKRCRRHFTSSDTADEDSDSDVQRDEEGRDDDSEQESRDDTVGRTRWSDTEL